MSHDPQSPTDAADYEDHDYDQDDGFGTIGCYDCEGGWNHTCFDDLCRNCNEAEDCEDGGRPCKRCNPHGEGR